MRRWRRPDFGCWRVGLVAMIPRVDCPMRGVVVASVPWAEPGSRFTRDLEVERACLMTVASQETVSGLPYIAWRTAGDIARRVAGRPGAGMPLPFDGLTSIGVDKTSYRKGHTYITVAVDHERNRVYPGIRRVRQRRVRPVLPTIDAPERRASIWIVTGDGARRIDSCVHEWCPNAERVPDGFHIVSWMADALGKISRRLWNQARGNGDDEAARRMRGVRYAVLKNPGRLAGRQDESPTALRNTDPRGRLYRARQLKELLRGLLGHPIGQAEDELKHWVFRASRSRIPEIVESARKIRRRRPDILRTIGSGYPNARLEAFNDRIKVTIRMAYGFQRVTNLISLIMLRCGGLDIRLPEPVS